MQKICQLVGDLRQHRFFVNRVQDMSEERFPLQQLVSHKDAANQPCFGVHVNGFRNGQSQVTLQLLQYFDFPQEVLDTLFIPWKAKDQIVIDENDIVELSFAGVQARSINIQSWICSPDR